MSADLRCFCARKPLLAVGGRDSKTGQPFLHVKSVRKDRINTEVIITSGSARIRCRDCLRWHTVTIIEFSVEAKPEELPASIAVP